MGSIPGRGWRAAVVIACCAVVAASCGFTDQDDSPRAIQGESDATMGSSESDDGSVSADDPDNDEDGGTVAGGETIDGSLIWTRHDPTPFLPNGPQSQFRGALPPDETAGWTVVGSVFNYETTQGTAATWETADVTSGQWTRTDVSPSGPDDETMIGVARAGGLEIAVGSRGELGSLQPAVWSRTVGGP